MRAEYALITLLPLLLSDVASSHVNDVVHPPVDESETRIPLYFSLIQSFSAGQYISAYNLPGLEMALDFINGDDTLLPGYSLHYVFTDAAVTKVDS